jgi:predicted dehydrogenase
MKILIVGFGSIGRRHFRNLLHLGVHDFVFLRSGRSTLPDDEIADFPVETNIKSALAHQPDAVVISTPTALHLDVAIPAAENGCHLFIEKPISHTMDRVDLLEKIVDQNHIRVLVGFHYRFHPGLQKVKDLITDQIVGRSLSVRVHWGEYLPNWHPWEDYRTGYSARSDLGGGVILTLCHPLDYLRWMLGEVEAVWAFSDQLSDLALKVEDTAEIGLRFQNRVVGSVHLDYSQRPSSHRLEIIGTHGTIQWENTKNSIRYFSVEADSWIEEATAKPIERNDIFLEEMRHFLAVIQGKEQSICSLQDGTSALQLALAAHQSSSYQKLVEI